MTDDAAPPTMAKTPTLLDLSKVRAFADDENQAAAKKSEAPPLAVSGEPGEAMPFRRRYSDLEAMARAKKAAAWVADAQHRLHRHRKSFQDGGTNARVLSMRLRMQGSQDDGVVLPRRQQHQRVVFKSSVAMQQGIESKKYTEMVERFQIRRMPHPSASHHTTHSLTTSRTMSTASSVKVYPGVALEAETADSLAHARQSRHSISSVGRSSLGRQSIQIPEDDSRRDLVDAAAMEEPRISWRVWWQQLIYDLQSPLSPVSKTSQARSVLLVAGFVFHMIYFPLETAYLRGTSHSGVGEWLEEAFGVVLVVDCLVTLNTSYYDKRGELVTSRKAIAQRYARGWLALDLLSSIPVDWIFSHTMKLAAGTRWAYAVLDGGFRLPRLIHVTQITREAWQPRLHESDRSIFTLIFYSRYSHLVSIARMIVFIVIGAHYMACILKLLTVNVPASSITPYAEYVSNLYDALQLLQGQGVETGSVAESLFAAVSLLAGSIVLAIVFGHVAILVSNFNANSTNYQRKMESVFAIMSKLQLPAPLRERIHQYYEHLWREYESLDGEIVSFSKGLSHTLELEVVLFKYMDLIMHVPFWCDGSPDFQKQLMLHLSVRVYLPDDFIIRRGEVGDEFFMINRGVCELVLGPDSFEFATDPLSGDSEVGNNSLGRSTGGLSGKTPRKEYFECLQAPLSGRLDGDTGCSGVLPSRSVQILGRGQAFGEMALLMNYERTADVRALSYVEMCILKRSDVQEIFLKHPKDRNHVIKSILTRVMEHNERNDVECPLRSLVSGVFGSVGRENDLEQEASAAHGAAISATHAALLLTAAIDKEAEDASIIFGIGDSLRQKLLDLKMKDEQADTLPSQNVAESDASAHEDQRTLHPRRIPASATMLSNEMSQRLEDLHRAQQQLLRSMEDLRRDLQSARDNDMALFQ